MNIIIALLATIASSFWAASAGAGEELLSAAQNNTFEFMHFLRYRPLDLGELLGKHFSEVVPGSSWESLSIPEEYKNPTIRYGVFVRADLHGYMKNWGFYDGDQAFCADETPIFKMIAKNWDGPLLYNRTPIRLDDTLANT